MNGFEQCVQHQYAIRATLSQMELRRLLDSVQKSTEVTDQMRHVFVSGISRAMQLPSALIRYIRDFIEPVQRWEMDVYNTGVSDDSEQALRMLLLAYGYDPQSARLLDDRDTLSPVGSVVPEDLHYVWCHHPWETSRLMEHYGLQHVVLVGTLQGIIDTPVTVENPTLQSITYLLPRVTAITDGWMFRCPRLHTVGFIGMPSLQSVGGNWLSLCTGLTSIRFEGLSGLTSIGGYWLFGCSELPSIDYNGLDNLFSVGTCWSKMCVSLTTIDFHGLHRLRHVAGEWLVGCRDLTTVQFVGLSRLETVGSEWLVGCPSLHHVDFTGLDSMVSVGDYWLFNCASLLHVNFTGLNSMMSIGNNWLGWCPNLDSDTRHRLEVLLSKVKHVGREYWQRATNRV
jgi:hypothetical protein